MEKFFKWGNDLPEFDEGIDDCQREDIRERAINYFSDRKDAYSDMFEDLVRRGKEALEDEETKEILKLVLLIIIALILLVMVFSIFRRRK